MANINRVVLLEAPPDSATKVCTACGVEKGVEYFVLKGKGRTARRSICDDCRVGERLLAVGGIARGSTWWLPCSFCGETFKRVSWNTKRIATNIFCSDRCKSKASGLRRKFGLEPREFREMWEAQQGLCAMPGCLKILGLFGSDGHHVDHDHATGKVRGLLCHGCNVALGGYERMIALGADLYLEREWA